MLAISLDTFDSKPLPFKVRLKRRAMHVMTVEIGIFVNAFVIDIRKQGGDKRSRPTRQQRAAGPEVPRPRFITKSISMRGSLHGSTAMQIRDLEPEA
jgi:hypothetical protein